MGNSHTPAPVTPSKVEIVSSTKLRSNLSSVLKDAESGQITLIKRGSRAEVALIDTNTLENLLLSSDKQLVESIAEARKQINQGQFHEFDEVFGEI